MSIAGPPDIVLLGPEWPERALLRAQLIEEGYEVVATDAWPIPRQYLEPGMKPHVVIVDLHGLPDPQGVLDELHHVIPTDRILVVTALGTLPGDDLRRRGFHVKARPATVGEIVTAAATLLRRGRSARLPQKGGDVLQISISDQDASMLRELLDAKLIDLRREISHTDSPRFREKLYQVEAMLQRLIAQLPNTVTTPL